MARKKMKVIERCIERCCEPNGDELCVLEKGHKEPHVFKIKCLDGGPCCPGDHTPEHCFGCGG